MNRFIIKKVLKNFTIILSTLYIVWRIIFTIPIGFGVTSLILGLIFILIEIIDFIEFFVHYKNILSYEHNENKINKNQTEEYPDVDIIIATFNEEEQLLNETIKGCLNINYPNKEKLHIYVCDDGNREEIKKLAQKNGINYIRRKNNKNAKAGNYNNALQYLKSDYILTLDADMIPKEKILMDIMPYFINDDKIGFVQTPQAFYNYDIYQNRFMIKDKIPFDQSFFYNYIQDAKSAINATVYCGTNAVLSRKALNKIGGFATGTLTEDIATRYVNRKRGV